MPSDERVRLHDREDATPLDQPRQRDERNPSRIVGAPRLHLPLHIQCQLLSQEQVLGGEVCMRSPRRRDQPKEIAGDAQDGSKRGAGTRLGHGRRIVCDALVQERPSQKYRDRPSGPAPRGAINFAKNFAPLGIIADHNHVERACAGTAHETRSSRDSISVDSPGTRTRRRAWSPPRDDRARSARRGTDEASAGDSGAWQMRSRAHHATCAPDPRGPHRSTPPDTQRWLDRHCDARSAANWLGACHETWSDLLEDVGDPQYPPAVMYAG